MKGKVFIKVFNKRHIMLIVSIMILIIAGIFNPQLNHNHKKGINPSVIEVSKQNNDTNLNRTIDEIKLNREIERSKMVDQLKNLLAQYSNYDSKIIEDKISELVERSNKEMMCENIIASKGIAENVVLSSDGVIYVVADYNLTKQKVIQIQNIVQNIFGVKLNAIRITSLTK